MLEHYGLTFERWTTLSQTVPRSVFRYVFNVYVHHNACELKNFKLSSDIFTHVLSMDQSFFDTHSVSEIRGGMNVHALSNLICWNLPYILTKYLKLAFDVAFLCKF